MIATMLSALLLTSPENNTPPHILPAPPIPEALRGCWSLDDPDLPGVRSRILVTDRVLRDGETREGRAQYITAVSRKSIEGRFTAVEDGFTITVATGLEIADGSEGGRPGQLIFREGDAGSFTYSRCSK